MDRSLDRSKPRAVITDQWYVVEGDFPRGLVGKMEKLERDGFECLRILQADEATRYCVFVPCDLPEDERRAFFDGMKKSKLRLFKISQEEAMVVTPNSVASNGRSSLSAEATALFLNEDRDEGDIAAHQNGAAKELSPILPPESLSSSKARVQRGIDTLDGKLSQLEKERVALNQAIEAAKEKQERLKRFLQEEEEVGKLLTVMNIA